MGGLISGAVKDGWSCEGLSLLHQRGTIKTMEVAENTEIISSVLIVRNIDHQKTMGNY